MKTVTKHLLKHRNRKIGDANLRDYNAWLDGTATEIDRRTGAKKGGATAPLHGQQL